MNFTVSYSDALDRLCLFTWTLSCFNDVEAHVENFTAEELLQLSCRELFAIMSFIGYVLCEGWSRCEWITTTKLITTCHPLWSTWPWQWRSLCQIQGTVVLVNVGLCVYAIVGQLRCDHSSFFANIYKIAKDNYVIFPFTTIKASVYIHTCTIAIGAQNRIAMPSVVDCILKVIKYLLTYLHYIILHYMPLGCLPHLSITICLSGLTPAMLCLWCGVGLCVQNSIGCCLVWKRYTVVRELKINWLIISLALVAQHLTVQ